ncbi:YceD family protein [Aestuariivirga sp.]|uniref:YceD family protein n=1 Tax=Aestuariivirga sp. TaxID=2650926 RepID=UPI0039E31BC9
MTGPSPEFSRPLRVDRVPKLGSTEKIEADPAERTALAKRLEIPALHGLSAKLRATPWRGGGLQLDGAVEADLEQVSVVSLELFRHSVAFPVLRYFLPPGREAEADEEEIDVIENGIVDLGEVVAEALALELDPYPRRPGEAFDDQPAPEVEEKPPSPFAALSRLHRKE